MGDLFYVKSLVLVVVLSFALYQDIREGRIKNIITLPAALAGIIINTLDSGAGGLLLSVRGWVVPVLVLIFFYRINAMGAGDIKLFAAAGALMGLHFAACSFIFSVGIGGAAALLQLLKRGIFLEKMGGVLAYFIFMAAAGTVVKYDGGADGRSRFIFSLAIVPGTLAQLFIEALKASGVTVYEGWFVWF
ncbi:MAG: A24 family peptidase [Bacillota bacterium]